MDENGTTESSNKSFFRTHKKSTSIMCKEQSMTKTNKKDAAMLLSNFTRKFTLALRRLNIKEEEYLDYTEYSKLLQSLGCIKNLNEPKASPKVKELWDTLKDSLKVSKEVLFTALCDILLIPVPEQRENNNWNKRFYEFYSAYLLNTKNKCQFNRPKPTLSQDYTFHPQFSQRQPGLATVQSTKNLMSIK